MFKIQSVKINNFWYRFNAGGNFNDDVNIIIGRNGTGKTTFMNILHAVLSVEVDGISENAFESATINLIQGEKKKTVKVKKIDDPENPYLIIEYRISNKKYLVRIITHSDPRRMQTS